MHKCFYCGAEAVGWEKDFTFEDYGMMGEGIVQSYHCNNCDAEIEYYIRFGEEENNKNGYDESTATQEGRAGTGTAMAGEGRNKANAVPDAKRNNTARSR